MSWVMNLSELHKLPDLLVVQRTVLSVVLADEVLEETHNTESATVHQFKVQVCQTQTHTGLKCRTWTKSAAKVDI